MLKQSICKTQNTRKKDVEVGREDPDVMLVN